MCCLPVTHPISCSWGTSSCLMAVMNVCPVLVVCFRLLFYLYVFYIIFMYALCLLLSVSFFSFVPSLLPLSPSFRSLSTIYVSVPVIMCALSPPSVSVQWGSCLLCAADVSCFSCQLWWLKQSRWPFTISWSWHHLSTHLIETVSLYGMRQYGTYGSTEISLHCMGKYANSVDKNMTCIISGK